MKIAAAFTMARNQPIFLRLWCNYYCGQLGPENCWVICEPNDVTLDDAKNLWPACHFIDLPSPFKTMHTQVDELELWRRQTVREWQEKLLQDYKCCIFADTDEFLIPAVGGLSRYCEQFTASGKPSVRSEGWTVVHQLKIEPTLTLVPGNDVLEGRSLMRRLPRYDKTLLTKVPLRYSPGFHNLTTEDCTKRVNIPVNANLQLLHAWQLDVSFWTERQHLCADVSQVEQFFQTGIAPWAPLPEPPLRPRSMYGAERCPVPEHWRGLLRW